MADFTNPGNPMNISELLVSAGYPHLNITEGRRHWAYECILLYEVVTKRIPAMDDLRKGFAAVKVSGMTLLELLNRFPKLQQRVFPPNTWTVQANLLKLHIQWEDCLDAMCQRGRQFLCQYIDEVDQRGEYGSLLHYCVASTGALLQCHVGAAMLFTTVQYVKTVLRFTLYASNALQANINKHSLCM